ncbi:MAG: dTDP-4-dehydrorhamnose reductase [Nitrospirota bacterium]
MSILITGANGQLATEFIRRLGKSTAGRLIALTRAQLDITDAKMVSDALSRFRPGVVINCAAYNLVDDAEKDFDTALRVNAVGVRNLAAACRKVDALIVHYSTDYVFDGTKEELYTEEDAPHPINKYGETKLAGERVLADESDNFLLFRVSWVFGQGRQNFLYKISEWAKQNKVLRIASDQVSIPTSAEDIATTTLAALENGMRGTYHLTNGGYASRYEVARYYGEKCGLSSLILPVPSDFFPAAARRPYFSAMSNRKISNALAIRIPHWRDAVDRFVRRMEVR